MRTERHEMHVSSVNPSDAAIRPRKVKTKIAWVVLATMLSAWVPAVTAHSLDDFEQRLKNDERYVEIVDRQLPDIVLRDSEDVPVNLNDLRGRVVVLNFIYASCPDVCPLQSEMIAEVQDVIRETPLRDEVQFISITTDPVNDTPEVMEAYGPLHGLDPANWSFLTTGASSTTQTLLDQFGLRFDATSDGFQVHGLVTHVIDKEGKLRARYHGLRFDVENLVRQLGELAKDNELHVETAGQPGAPRPSQGTSRTVLWLAIVVGALGFGAIGAGGTLYARRRTRA